MRRSRLTTVDNPHDPFTEYHAWFAYDLSSGYNSGSLLARILVDSDELSEADKERANELAIDEIVRENVNGKFKKVVKEF